MDLDYVFEVGKGVLFVEADLYFVEEIIFLLLELFEGDVADCYEVVYVVLVLEVVAYYVLVDKGTLVLVL